jgi:hypothetical protein
MTPNFNIDLTQVILWQYSNNPQMVGLINNKQAWFNTNVNQFWNDWYRDVYNLETANDFGLGIWAIIMGMRFSAPVIIPNAFFGFNSNATNFQAGFYPSFKVNLTTEQKRLILQLRVAYLTSNSTIDNIAAEIRRLIPDMLILDGLNMTIVLTYPVPIPSLVAPILNTFFKDIIPIPAGVKVIQRINYSAWFGFGGSGGQNFNNGGFGG